MARFAFWKCKASGPDTLNLAGGQAHTMGPKLEFASALLTTFTTDTFYKSAGDQVKRIAELTQKLEDPLFAAKAAVYTRKKNALRSVSHIVAGELSRRVDVNGRPVRIASLFAGVLFKSQAKADVMLFDTQVQHLRLHPDDSLTTLTRTIEQAATGGGTDFRLIFQNARKAYDRILILSDMQAWVGNHTPAADLAVYKRKFKADPRIFSFDLTGHGTLQFPESRVFALAGFSDAVLGTLKNLEQDPEACSVAPTEWPGGWNCITLGPESGCVPRT